MMGNVGLDRELETGREGEAPAGCFQAQKTALFILFAYSSRATERLAATQTTDKDRQ